jgi:hypothetical protein
VAASNVSFAAQIDAWTKRTKARQVAVFRISTQELMTRIVMTAPVDTGFMRAGFVVQVNAPLPPLAREKPAGAAAFPAPNLTLAITNAKIGDYITGGFVATYAAHVHFGAQGRAPRPWVSIAAAQWPQIVQNAVTQAKAAVAPNKGR